MRQPPPHLLQTPAARWHKVNAFSFHICWYGCSSMYDTARLETGRNPLRARPHNAARRIIPVIRIDYTDTYVHVLVWSIINRSWFASWRKQSGSFVSGPQERERGRELSIDVQYSQCFDLRGGSSPVRCAMFSFFIISFFIINFCFCWGEKIVRVVQYSRGAGEGDMLSWRYHTYGFPLITSCSLPLRPHVCMAVFTLPLCWKSETILYNTTKIPK